MDDILYQVKGVNGTLTAYEDRIIIERDGAFGFLSQGLAGTKTIPMTSIQSVQFREGGMLANGFIQFGILGGREAKGGVLGAANDENSVMLRVGEQTRKGREIKEYIEERIFALSKQKDMSNNSGISIADEILKLKQLLDMGVITQEEFENKKTELLK